MMWSVFANLKEEESRTVISEANEMLNGYYRFNGIWDMEPFLEPKENKHTSWNLSYKGDKEWTYMFTRMGYLYKFILATELTDEPKYIRHGYALFCRWYKDNWIFLGNKKGRLLRKFIKRNNLGHRTLDVAIMLTNIVDYVLYCKRHDYITKKEYKKSLQIINEGIKFILSNSADYTKEFINWGILENGSIVYCSLVLGIDESYKIAYSRLKKQVHNQIRSDGSQIESSPMYLVQILLVLLKILKEAKDNRCNDLVIPTLQGCAYIANIAKLDNTIPNIGDSDLTDISDLMIIASQVLHQDSFLQNVTNDLSPEFCIKYKLCRDSTKTEEKAQDYYDFVNEYRYQTILKSKREDHYLLCSNYPYIAAGHKHYDYLSVLYSEFGKDVLIDLGRYSYKDDSQRQFYKGPSAHNTICVLDHPYYKYINAWKEEQQIMIILCYRMKIVLGFSEITIIRYVTYLKEIGLIITDRITSKTDHKYQAFFNIGCDFRLSRGEKDSIVFCDNFDNYLYYTNDIKKPVEINQVNYSKKYNEKTTVFQLQAIFTQSIVTHFFSKHILNLKTDCSENGFTYSLSPNEFNIHIAY